MNLFTNHEQIILASSSQTRVNFLREHFKKVLVVRHKIKEEKIKNDYSKTSFKGLVKLLAKKKAESIMKDYPENMIIGSDQILVCKES